MGINNINAIRDYDYSNKGVLVMDINNEKQLIAHTEHLNYGDHGGFIVTIYKPDGDIVGTFRPIAYAGVYINPKSPVDIDFQTTNGDLVSFPFQNENLCQKVMKAIAERKECKFYYGD